MQLCALCPGALAQSAQLSSVPPKSTTSSLYAPVDMDKLDRKHDENNTLSVDALTLHSSLKAESFKPIRLEIAYDESITLAEALHYAIENNLAIKISRDNLNYQRYVLYGSIANALPNLSVAYNLTKTNILNLNQNAFAKVFLTRVTYPVFQGGSVAYSILGQLARERG